MFLTVAVALTSFSTGSGDDLFFLRFTGTLALRVCVVTADDGVAAGRWAPGMGVLLLWTCFFAGAVCVDGGNALLSLMRSPLAAAAGTSFGLASCN